MKRGVHAALLSVLLWSAAAWAVGDPTPVWHPAAERLVIEAETLEDCEGIVERFPAAFEGYACFSLLALRHGAYADAARRLETRLAIEPDNHRARLFLGWARADRGMPAAVDDYRQAQAGFEREGDLVGQVFARAQLAFWFFYSGRPDQSRSELAAADELALASGEPLLVAHVRYIEGFFANATGELERGLLALREAESLAFPDGPVSLQALLLRGLAFTHQGLGRYREALEVYRREEGLLPLDDPGRTASHRLNIAQAAARVFRPRPMGDEELCAMADEALHAARATNNPYPLMGALQLVAATCRFGEERIELLEELLAVRERSARPIGGDPQIVALGLLAVEEARRPYPDVDRIESWLDRSLAVALAGVGGRQLSTAYMIRARVFARLGRHREAVAASLSSLAELERTRNLQVDGTMRARSFATYSPQYVNVVDYLLRRDTAEDVAMAFDVLQRMQARALLDELDGSGATTAIEPDHPGVALRREILEQVARVQRELLGGTLNDSELRERRERLARLELDELKVRREIAHADPTFAAVRQPESPSLEQVQAALGTDQLLLTFVLSAPRRDPGRQWGKGSWVLAIGRDRIDVQPLDADYVELTEEVEIYAGMLQRRDGLASSAGEHLRRLLLDPILSRMSAHIRRIVVVADGPLHSLPIAALPDAEGGELGARYAISRAPSAAVWLALRDRPAAPRDPPALILADPAIDGFDGRQVDIDSPIGRARRLGEWPELRSLEFARREGRSMRRRLGRHAELLEGSAATETALKRSLSAPPRLLHLAAHAVVDGDRPDRSAIVLRPGSESEDGLLQIREIVDLDLRGSVILLSTCNSAAGLTLQGEGVLGLSRAFFVAGARSVVGSLWPVSDDATYELVTEVGRHLATGASVGEALTRARRSAVARGRAPIDWAGLVVLGDADAIPFPGGVEQQRTGVRRLGFVLAGVIGFVLLAIAARRFLGRAG